MPSKHATLSASAAHRWLNCPPSALLNARVKDQTSDFAREGTAAHELCEHKLKQVLEIPTQDPVENLDYYNSEMESCAEQYSTFVLEQVVQAKQVCKDPTVLIEQRLDFSQWVPDGFGTGDCVIVADNTLQIVDYKHGLGVLVEADNNPQMMLYALGALAMFDGIYDIDNITMTIFQPRRENISTWSIDKVSLLDWAENVLKPVAEAAIKGEGDFKAGDHCRFCKVKATCRKRAEYNLELAKYDFAVPDKLTDREVEAILAKAEQFATWVSDIKEYALKQAVSGKAWHGWKLVEGRSVRKYINEEVVARVVSEAGYDPYEHKVLGITAMTKTLGKKTFEELLGQLIEKPAGKPTLVPASDKRPAINTATSDFKEAN